MRKIRSSKWLILFLVFAMVMSLGVTSYAAAGGNTKPSEGGGTSVTQELDASAYNVDSYVFWDTMTTSSSSSSGYTGTNANGAGVQSVTLNGLSVAWANSNNTSWSTSGAYQLKNYYPGVTAGSANMADVTLEIVPEDGYYVTKVVIGCTSQGSSTPYNCNTWLDGNAFEQDFTISSAGTISIDMNSLNFSHTSSAPYYFVLVEVSPLPTPLYVEYNYGDILNLVDTTDATPFDTASAWLSVSSDNYYGVCDAGDLNGVITANTQLKYTYPSSLTTDAEKAAAATEWTHYANSVSAEALAFAAENGYYFAGWSVSYYREASAVATSGSYNNYELTFSSLFGTSDSLYAANEEVNLANNAVLTAVWKPIELTVSKTVEGLTGTFAGSEDHTYTLMVQKLVDDEWVDYQEVSLTITGDGTASEVLSGVPAGTYRAVEIDGDGNLSNDSTILVNTVASSDQVELSLNNTAAAVNVTNSYTETAATTDITVSKVWDDEDNLDGSRPDSVTIVLLCNGEATNDFLVLSADNNWTGTFASLVKYTGDTKNVYTVVELGVDGYTYTITGNAEDGYTVTNSHEPVIPTTTIVIEKTWEDYDNFDGSRPESVDVTLYVNGEENQTVTLSEDNNWQITIENVAVYQDVAAWKAGTENVFTVEEAAVDGYTATYDSSFDGETYSFAITNAHTPDMTTVDVAVAKAWDDYDNFDGSRPESVDVTLFINGEAFETVTLSADSDWTYVFEGLDLYADTDAQVAGTENVFTVEEAAVDGYTATYDSSFDGETYSFVITNAHTPDITTTDITVTKVWDDQDDVDGLRPESLDVTLYIDGEASAYTVTLSDANDWTATFEGIAAFADVEAMVAGEGYVFSVVEEDVLDYTAEITGDAVEGFVITNTHEVVEEVVPEEVVPEEVVPEEVVSEEVDDVVQTGDTMNLNAVLGIMALAAAALVALLVGKKRAVKSHK